MTTSKSDGGVFSNVCDVPDMPCGVSSHDTKDSATSVS